MNLELKTMNTDPHTEDMELKTRLELMTLNVKLMEETEKALLDSFKGSCPEKKDCGVVIGRVIEQMELRRHPVLQVIQEMENKDASIAQEDYSLRKYLREVEEELKKLILENVALQVKHTHTHTHTCISTPPYGYGVIFLC